MAQSIERPTLAFGSGQDLTVCKMEPCVELCAESAISRLGILSFSLSAPP